MGETPRGGAEPEAGIGRAVRELARVFEPFHSLGYYTDEILRMNEHGFRGWWHAYFAYRFAPMGAVPAAVVTATAYGFAPRFVERAVPGVWEILPPEDVLARHRELEVAALDRIFGDGRFDAQLAEAASLARASIEHADVVGKPLFAAHADLRWPEKADEVLLHACGLLREHRGDCHVVALAAAGVDGIECHLLMAAHGQGNQPTIEGIRGWNAEEWNAAAARLEQRGWLNPDGSQTTTGQEARVEIERHTDRLAREPVDRLGQTGTARLTELLGELVGHLLAQGEIPGVWPPPAVIKSAGSVKKSV